VNLKLYLIFWPGRTVAGLSLLLLLALAASIGLDSAHGITGSPEGYETPVRAVAIAGLAGTTLGRIAGTLIGRLLGRGVAAAAPTVIRPGTTALATRSSSTVAGALARRGALFAGGGAAFELGSRALPGGSGFPLGGGGGGAAVAGGGAGALQVGQRFGDTFITRMWQSGQSREGVPIMHGMLANGRRFVTNRFGTIKTFRPKKNIVIGPDPRLSDARKVARAAQKMENAAITILKVTGKKAVKR